MPVKKELSDNERTTIAVAIIGAIAAVLAAVIGGVFTIWSVAIQQPPLPTLAPTLPRQQSALSATNSFTSTRIVQVTNVAPTATLVIPTFVPTNTLQPKPTDPPTLTNTPLPPTNTPLPSVTSTPTVKLPFADPFNLRARAEWETWTGTWKVVNGHYVADSNSSWAISVVGDDNWSNYTVEALVYASGEWERLRVLLRSSPRGYMIFQVGPSWGSIDGGDAEFILSVGNDEKSITKSEIKFNRKTPIKIKIEVKEDVYTAYVNSKQVLQIQDTNFSRGKVGLSYKDGQSAWFDDFTVTEIK